MNSVVFLKVNNMVSGKGGWKIKFVRVFFVRVSWNRLMNMVEYESQFVIRSKSTCHLLFVHVVRPREA